MSKYPKLELLEVSQKNNWQYFELKIFDREKGEITYRDYIPDLDGLNVTKFCKKNKIDMGYYCENKD